MDNINGTGDDFQDSHIKKIALEVMSTSLPDSSTSSQKTRLMKFLDIVGSIGVTTIQLRELLDIMNPHARIFDLRQDGKRIETIWTTSTNAQGNKHKNARYVLINAAPASLGAS